MRITWLSTHKYVGRFAVGAMDMGVYFAGVAEMAPSCRTNKSHSILITFLLHTQFYIKSTVLYSASVHFLT